MIYCREAVTIVTTVTTANRNGDGCHVGHGCHGCRPQGRELPKPTVGFGQPTGGNDVGQVALHGISEPVFCIQIPDH